MSQRSPISEYALTLDELVALGPGAEIAFFSIHDGATPGVFSHVDERKVYLQNGESRYLRDCGLVPLANGKFSDANITIRANNIGNMPEKTPRPASDIQRWLEEME